MERDVANIEEQYLRLRESSCVNIKNISSSEISFIIIYGFRDFISNFYFLRKNYLNGKDNTP